MFTTEVEFWPYFSSTASLAKHSDGQKLTEKVRTNSLTNF